MENKPMTVGKLRESIKDCHDDTPIEFSCSCSRKGGYDGWKAEIELKDSYVEFYLNGYHEDYGKVSFTKIKVGDIVRFFVENHDSSIFPPSGGLGQVIIRSGELVILTPFHRLVTIGKGYDAYPGRIEIIGNVTDNRDLLDKSYGEGDSDLERIQRLKGLINDKDDGK